MKYIPPRKLTLLPAFVLLHTLLSPLCAQTPILQYSFDEGKELTAKDSSPSPSDGLLQGTAGWISDTPNKKGAALNLSSGLGTDYLEANSDKLSGLKAVTITFWINFNDQPQARDKILSTLGMDWKGIDLGITSGNTDSPSAADFRLTLGINGEVTKSPIIKGNDLHQWIFLAVTFDSSSDANNVIFYVGGTEKSPTAHVVGSPISISAGALGQSTGMLRIGSTEVVSEDRTPPVIVDDFRVYDCVLDESQIESIRLEGIE